MSCCFHMYVVCFSARCLKRLMTDVAHFSPHDSNSATVTQTATDTCLKKVNKLWMHFAFSGVRLYIAQHYFLPCNHCHYKHIKAEASSTLRLSWSCVIFRDYVMSIGGPALHLHTDCLRTLTHCYIMSFSHCLWFVMVNVLVQKWHAQPWGPMKLSIPLTERLWKKRPSHPNYLREWAIMCTRWFVRKWLGNGHLVKLASSDWWCAVWLMQHTL